MEESIFSNKVIRIMFFVMLGALIIIALRPSKMIILGDTSGNTGEINIDAKKHNSENRTNQIKETEE